jgi:hypothetical protein
MSVAWARKCGVVLGALAAVVLAGCIRFAPPVTLSISGVTSLADVTGDGTADLLVDDGASLTRREYCGTGCLQTEQTFSGQHVRSIADFNGDGVADVLTWELVSPGNATDRVLFGGASGLGNAVTVPSAPDRDISAVGDFNGDGRADLVRRGRFDVMNEQFVVYVGDGLGGFTASTLRAVFPLTEGSVQLDVADIDGDGHDDLVVTIAGFLGVFRFGDPSCSQGTCTYVFTSVGGTDPTFGDIDGDGRDDFALHSSQGIVFFRSTGSGFTPFPAYQTITAPAGQIKMGLRDIDGDGVTDFLLNDTVNQRTWWSGTNDGGFPYQAVSDVPVEVSGCRDCMGDVDGDGRLDAVSGNEIWFNTSF